MSYMLWFLVLLSTGCKDFFLGQSSAILFRDAVNLGVVPGGLGSHIAGLPPLKRWAILCRPATGLVPGEYDLCKRTMRGTGTAQVR